MIDSSDQPVLGQMGPWAETLLRRLTVNEVRFSVHVSVWWQLFMLPLVLFSKKCKVILVK